MPVGVSRMQAGVRVVIALATLALTAITFWFTKSFNEAQAANSRAQVVASIIPMLANDSARTRLLACSLAERVDLAFALVAARELGADPDAAVRACASRIAARALVKRVIDQPFDLFRKGAADIFDQQFIENEIKARRLDLKVEEAATYMEFGRDDKAAAVYREVVEALSSASRAKLDKELLAQAEKDFDRKDFKSAANKYRSLLGG